MKPNIQEYFKYRYDGSGNLTFTIDREFVNELKWQDADFQLSFGGITRMNDWGSDVRLTIQRK
jgi:hypothetical protein